MRPGAEIPRWNSAPFIRHTSKIHTAPIDGKAFGRRAVIIQMLAAQRRPNEAESMCLRTLRTCPATGIPCSCMAKCSSAN
jgi:hypothetical protein